MGNISRASTPLQAFRLPIGIEYDKIEVTYAQNGQQVLKKTLADGEIDEEGVFKYKLTQAETKAFSEGDIEIQLRALSGDDVFQTEIFQMSVDRVLDDTIL